MMQEHVARAGRIGAGVGSDDSVEAEDRLDRIALEPLVEQVAGRAGEELEEVALAFEIERAQAVSGSRRVDEGAEAGDKPLSGRDVRGRGQRERTQDVSQARKPRLIGVEALGVAGGEFRDLGLRAAGCDLEIAPVGQRQEVRQGTLDDAEPVAVKLEVADDLGVEKRDGVGGDRIAEAGMECLGRRRAADLRAPLEHRDLEAGHGEIGGGDKAVVAGADDDDVRHQVCMARTPSPPTPLPRERGDAEPSPSGRWGEGKARFSGPPAKANSNAAPAGAPVPRVR